VSERKYGRRRNYSWIQNDRPKKKTCTQDGVGNFKFPGPGSLPLPSMLSLNTAVSIGMYTVYSVTC
jgi:hypothetical protein